MNYLGYSHMDIVGGAGHDAHKNNESAPAAMIFCACVDGLSPKESEELHARMANTGADGVMNAALETAGVVG